ncbi:hypothetical protein KAI92_01310 [Candidatus Parcubacteria bacterium]|nr:hypothetical protein [Candidatus Parcubacteria bacterium]
MSVNRKEKFIKIYANVPIGARREIVLVLEKKPISWDVAYNEISVGTPLGDIILKKLEKLEFI